MLTILSENLWMIATTLCLLMVYFYFRKPKSSDMTSFFLKDRKTLRYAKVSEIKSLSHDTIKVTLDFPDIYSTLGLPLGTSRHSL